jgi:crotonobetainyl-CoA:carnitine CoA-transferase CaiB-like acyl-CoA transferase
VSLYETAVGYIGYHLAGYLADGTVPRGEGTRFPMVAPYEVFPTADGELMIAGGNDRIFRSICEVVGLPELTQDPRFRTNPDRVRNRDALVALLVDRLADETTATWHRRLTDAGVPAAAVADVADVAGAEQTQALGILQHVPHPRIPDLTLAGVPLSFDGVRPMHPSAPPDVGADTFAVLREAGFADEEIAALATEGVVRT